MSAPVWPELVAAVVLAGIGLLLQSPRTLAGDPLAHLILAATAAALILHRLRERSPVRAGSPWSAVVLAVCGAVLAFLAPLAGGLRPALAYIALALVALSLIAAWRGGRMAANLAVPILVLYVLVPVLPLFEAALSYPLRRLSALLAAALLDIGPDAVTLHGTELSWGTLKVSVTSACSGLTLLQNLIWVAWWTVLLRHRGFVTRALHATLALPAVLAANTLRVVALAVMARWLGEESLVGPGHVVVGWAAVVLAVLLFLALEHLVPAVPAESDRPDTRSGGRSGSIGR